MGYKEIFENLLLSDEAKVQLEEAFTVAVEAKMTHLEAEYKEKEQEMVTIINKINVIELKAVPLKDRDLMMKCECKKAKLTNLMMYMQSKYGC